MNNTSRKLYTPLLGLRPYVVIELNGADQADVQVGAMPVTDAALYRDMARTMRKAARRIKREARKLRKEAKRVNAA